jgi:glycosyltransferase involved in cell wall biosynthesis
MNKKLFMAATIALALTGKLYSLPTDYEGKKVLIIADISQAHVGGTENVVLEIKKRLIQRGLIVSVVDFSAVPTFQIPGAAGESCPYPWSIKSDIATLIHKINPNYILIIPLGIMAYKAGAYCYEHHIPFTVFCSVRMPELVNSLFYFPLSISRYFVNGFLAKASNILVPTLSFEKELQQQGLTTIFTWPHGVDTEKFTLPTEDEKKQATIACNLENKPRPFYLFVGRITKAKNLEAFLNLDIPGTKILVGGENIGYSLDTLKKRFPDAVFPGLKQGKELLNYYQCSDIFVFPSKIDSFGLVLLEALACGLPIVGFNTFGPTDVVPSASGVSYLANVNDTLQEQAVKAWHDIQNNRVTPLQCRMYAEQFSWDTATDSLLDRLIAIDASVLDQAQKAQKTENDHWTRKSTILKGTSIGLVSCAAIGSVVAGQGNRLGGAIAGAVVGLVPAALTAASLTACQDKF